ncbi:hypothetical protein HELRODRAFT_177680 [Helobdella robusta]|uniref:UspA domain-containing protein n=1 Tax=Helobdella robusta TaxID=6412 RepID=T1FC26_HELRO|nr:hypothetical protein HELRODRAFT_177680 [Helobdella robusta]ESN98007.1 hypothetical protein HELRODRAFT_177680 [Helobdella robusta]
MGNGRSCATIHVTCSDTVLIGVDGSRAADEAIICKFRYYRISLFVGYLENLHRDNNLLILVHALESSTGPTRDTWESQVQIGKRKQEELQERYISRFKEWGISGRFLSDIEKPAEFLISSAKKKKATYLVMGSRGMGRMSHRRTIIGSVSDYVLHHSDCPVIVART